MSFSGSQFQAPVSAVQGDRFQSRGGKMEQSFINFTQVSSRLAPF